MLHIRCRLIAATTISALGLLAPISVHAQSVATTDAAARDDNGAQDAGEILVTAQRRTERLRDVPITITQVSGQQLEEQKITNVLGLSQMTPSLRIERSGPYVSTSLRGISSSFTSVNDSPIAYYIDGVYQHSLAGLNIEFADVKSIEVLKGPQGTLFGRNATGGAVLITTRDPEFDFTGNMTASYGNLNDVNIKAFVTGPLSDKIAISLSGGVHDNDGYYHDIINDKRTGRLKSENVRGKLLVQPSDNLRIKMIAFYTNRYDGSVDSSILNGNTLYGNVPSVIFPTRPYDYAGSDQFGSQETFGGSASIDLDTGIGKFSSLTAYNKVNSSALSDADRVAFKNYLYVGGGYDVIPDIYERGFSQELNFASRQFGRLSFIGGLYYFKSRGDIFPQKYLRTYPSIISQDLYSRSRVNAKAAYGEATFSVTDRLSLVAGLRYSTERRSLRGILVSPSGTPPPAELPLVGKRKDSAVTPRFVVKYQLNDDVNVYASYEGFQERHFQLQLGYAANRRSGKYSGFRAGQQGPPGRAGFQYRRFLRSI